MLLELGKAISFLLSIVSLFPAMYSAFFVPGAGWEERLFLSFDKIGLAACVCFASGFLFSIAPEGDPEAEASVLATMPVRMFFCALAAMAVLFVVSWYLAVYYIPLTYKNLPW